MGLRTAPAAFCAMVDRLLEGLPATDGYVDDLLTHSLTHAQHLVDLEAFFNKCIQGNVKLAPKKCHFGYQEVEYVGHLLSGEGVRPAADKLSAIRDRERPRSVAELRAYLGLANYLRQYMPSFSAVAEPLTRLTKKGCHLPAPTSARPTPSYRCPPPTCWPPAAPATPAPPPPPPPATWDCPPPLQMRRPRGPFRRPRRRCPRECAPPGTKSLGLAWGTASPLPQRQLSALGAAL